MEASADWAQANNNKAAVSSRNSFKRQSLTKDPFDDAAERLLNPGRIGRNRYRRQRGAEHGSPAELPLGRHENPFCKKASPALTQTLCQTIPAESAGWGLNAQSAQKFLPPAQANMRAGRYSRPKIRSILT
jgi:hypothetical protein